MHSLLIWLGWKERLEAIATRSLTEAARIFVFELIFNTKN